MANRYLCTKHAIDYKSKRRFVLIPIDKDRVCSNPFCWRQARWRLQYIVTVTKEGKKNVSR